MTEPSEGFLTQEEANRLVGKARKEGREKGYGEGLEESQARVIELEAEAAEAHKRGKYTKDEVDAMLQGEEIRVRALVADESLAERQRGERELKVVRQELDDQESILQRALDRQMRGLTADQRAAVEGIPASTAWKLEFILSGMVGRPVGSPMSAQRQPAQPEPIHKIRTL